MKDYSNKTVSIQKGSLLLAEPFLPDHNFFRSVVLITEHSQNGTVGFVLNHESDFLLSDLIDDVYNADYAVYIGGPVEQNTLHFIHKFHDVNNAIHISDGLYWGGDFDNIKLKLNIGKVQKNQIRFFLGYSGWGVGQLHMEIKSKSWFAGQLSDFDIFNNENKNMWRMVLKSWGEDYKTYANYPIDPTLN
ncbi:MAG: YqgE/AlgH family protein [Cytophagales bacterium]|nr:YqgE/AlgH family protein [Cytophagales bacterium]